MKVRPLKILAVLFGGFTICASSSFFAADKAYQAPPLGSYQVQASPNSEEFKSIQIEDHLGQNIDLDLSFVDSTGKEVKLADYFHTKKPVLLNLVYFNCPSLCGLLLNGISDALRRIDWKIGEHYEVITLSIDPEEDPLLASLKKENYIKDYGRPEAAAGWHFLTGKEENIKALAAQVGFGYRKVEETGEYAHSAGFFVLTPKGRISRVHYGVQFQPRDVKLSLLEASGGKIGSLADQVLLFCFRYDPNSKGYALAAFRIVQVGGAITALIIGIYLFIFWRRQRRISVAQNKG